VEISGDEMAIADGPEGGRRGGRLLRDTQRRPQRWL